MNPGLNNPADFPTEKEPNLDLLLTPEEEKQIRIELGDKNYGYELKSAGKALRVFGSKHVFSNVEGLDKAFYDFTPDLVMVEGNSSKHNLGNTLEESFYKGGESGGAQFLAKEKNIPVMSWDSKEFHLDGFIHEALKKFPDDAVVGLLLASTVRHILEGRGEAVNYDNIKSFLEPHVESLDRSFLSREFLTGVSQKYTGRNLEELTVHDVGELIDPSGEGETNKVNLWMIRQRDPAAVEKIWDHLKRFKRVFVVAGRSHAITWKPVFEDLLGKAEQLT